MVSVEHGSFWLTGVRRRRYAGIDRCFAGEAKAERRIDLQPEVKLSVKID